jgi:hypothetical protein
MEFEIKEDLAKEIGLNDDQIQRIKTYGKDYIADLHKSWDDKVKQEGNQYAEGILSGAAKLVEEKTGVNRKQGEKLADFFSRTGETYLTTKQQELDQLKSSYEEKIKGVKDGDKLAAELESYQKKVAELEPLQEYKSKYDELLGQHLTLKETTAFTSIKPRFPEGINEYEAEAKWNQFVSSVKEKYTIEMVDGKALAVDKENKYKQKDLSELVKENQELTDLLSKDGNKGNDGKAGFQAKPNPTTKIDGVPFEVPVKADSTTRANLIREYLVKQGVSTISDDYAKRFKELNDKILNGAKG